MVRAIFSWEFIITAHVVLICFALMGCSTFLTTTVGDHTIASGVWLERSVNGGDEVQRDE